MEYWTLVSIEELEGHLDDPRWRVVDCRFSLGEPESGRQEYLREHIAGAVYAHLDEDLSGTIVSGKTGRHPLPSVTDLEKRLSSWGISNQTQVIAYDHSNGAIASRLWWMLNWLGHRDVAVLDGGWKAWKEAGLPIRSGEEEYPRQSFEADPQPAMEVNADFVTQIREDPEYALIDARSRERFVGEVEPIDVKAGHIPGAICLPFAENLDERGRFLPPEELKARFESALSGKAVEKAVFYCGSGVTAAHNLLALKHAGMGIGRLYSGSWSEWITDPKRPIAKSEE